MWCSVATAMTACVSWLLISSEKMLLIGISHKTHSCHFVVKVSLKVNINAPKRAWTLYHAMVKAICYSWMKIKFRTPRLVSFWMHLVPDAFSRNSAGPNVAANISSSANASVEEERISSSLKSTRRVRDDSSRSDQKFMLPRTLLG